MDFEPKVKYVSMFESIQKCMNKIGTVFGPQFAVAINFVDEHTIKVCVTVFLERACDEVAQVNAVMHLVDGEELPNCDEWCSEVIDTLIDETNKLNEDSSILLN